MRNIGIKTVAIRSSNQPELIVSLSLHEISEMIEDKVMVFSEIVASSCDIDNLAISNAIGKTIDRAFKTGHGNLLAAVDEFPREEANKVFTNGIFTDISVARMLAEKDTAQSASEKVYAGNTLRMNLSLIVSMLNSDGVTLFTTDGRVIGFHLIVDNSLAEREAVAGGSRTKAFSALKSIHYIKAVLMRRQEGDIKLYVRP